MALPYFQTGFRLMAGQWFNAMIDTINNLVGQTTGTTNGAYKGTFNGTVGATTPSTGAFTNVTENGLHKAIPQIAVAAGSNSQANATLVTKSEVVITTVSATTRAIKLPVWATGLRIEVFNRATANAAKVYPSTGARIGLAATNALGSAKVAAGSGNIYLASSASRWVVMKGA